MAKSAEQFLNDLEKSGLVPGEIVQSLRRQVAKATTPVGAATIAKLLVDKGQTIGRSGMTGLAGGDHLHFTMLVGGEQVTPVDWWSQQWLQDRVLRKIDAAKAGGS